MRFTLSIDTDNDAFTPDPGPEVARILAKLAEHVADSGANNAGTLRDVNGNLVGTWGLRGMGGRHGHGPGQPVRGSYLSGLRRSGQ